MTSICIVDLDPVTLELLQRAFQEREAVRCIVLAADQAAERIADECRTCDGMITGIDLNDRTGGWDLARLAREANPRIPIGYLSDQHLSDWATQGVPNSVLINKSVDASEIAAAFLRFCRAPERTLGPTKSPLLTVPPRTRQASLNAAAEFMQAPRDELHDVLMQAPSFIAWLSGPEHHFAFANTAYRQLVERDVVGKRVCDVLPEIDAQGYIAVLDRIYRSGEPFTIKSAPAEFRLEDGTCKRAYLDLNYHAVRNAAGAITGLIVVGEDVTERHRAQQRIGALQNELLHVSRVNAMGMMASTIAHELNQPLTAIHNFAVVAKAMAERGDTGPIAVESLQGTIDAALRAGDIIRNLRAMTARRDIVREPVPLAEALREAAELATLGQSATHIAFDVPASITVQGDKVLIQQIVFNLVRNAHEAAEAEAVDVTIRAAEKDALIEISVTDTGPGIASTILPGVFDPFVTTKAEGTGIGLTISKAIVEAHGGVMTARNGAERGAVFCFTLAHSRSERRPPQAA